MVAQSTRSQRLARAGRSGDHDRVLFFELPDHIREVCRLDECVELCDARQEPSMASDRAEQITIGPDPVSYTHLDVYKRQQHGCPLDPQCRR